MYLWRKMTPEEQAAVLEYRKNIRVPWHSPPHLDLDGNLYYILTAACYEHAPIIGKSIARFLECEDAILNACRENNTQVFAWCVLPNHYHLLLQTERIKDVRICLGRFHGKSSRLGI